MVLPSSSVLGVLSEDGKEWTCSDVTGDFLHPSPFKDARFNEVSSPEESKEPFENRTVFSPGGVLLCAPVWEVLRSHLVPERHIHVCPCPEP